MKKILKFFKNKKNKINFSNIDFIFSIFLVLSVFYGYKLYNLQVINGSFYREKLNNQYYGKVTGKVLNRGDILFSQRDGGLTPAAVLKSDFTLAIDNRNLGEPEEVFKTLNSITEIDRDYFLKKASKEDDPYEEVKNNISNLVAKEIRDEKIPGVILVEDKNRNYPHSELASDVLGFLSYKGDDLKATYGIEKYYDNILKRDDSNVQVNIFADIFNVIRNINNNSILEKNIAKEGNIVLTIEPTVQAFLEKEVQKVDSKFGSQYTTALIMNPNNGEIVAMASSDNFDLNSSKKHYNNHLVEEIHEFGSIFKPLTVAIGLDSGSIDKDYTYNDTGSITLNTKTFYNFDKKGRGPETDLQTIISRSLNTGTAEIALEIGKSTFHDYLDLLKLGQRSGIDLPNEIKGRIDNVKNGKNIELATASFGQGIAPTGIGLARALASLANGGYLVEPHVVKKVEYGDLIPSKEIDHDKKKVKVLGKESVDQVTNYLVKSVDQFYFSGDYSNKDYGVAAKTGTAQIASKFGGYEENAFLHSYFGYFPNYETEEDQEKFFVFIFTVRPENVKYASGSLTDPFFNTVDFLINYYKVKPDRLSE